MPGLDLKVDLAGPLFDPGADAKTQQAAADVVRELTELGQQRLQSAFPQGLPVVTGNLRANVTAANYGPMAELNDGGVIYSTWIEGTSSRNASSRFKGYSTWRRTLQYLTDEAVPEVTERAAQRLAEELGG